MVSAFDFLDGKVAVPSAGDAGKMSAYDYLNQPQQMDGTARDIALPASSFAKGLGKAMGMAGDLQALGDKYISDPLIRLFGRDPNQTPSSVLDPQPATSAEWLQMGKKLGLTDRPDLQPQTPGERNEAAAFEGAGAALPFVPFAGIGGALPTIAAGAGGGLGSHLGGIAGEKLGYPRTGELLGGVVGGLGGQGIASGLVKAANATMGNYSALGRAYKDAGVPLNFTPDSKAAAYSSQSLGGSGRTLSLAKQEVDAFGRSVDQTASSLGNSTSLQELGQTAQDYGKKWVDNFKLQSNAAHTAVDNAVGQATPVAPSATRKLIADITAEAHGNTEAADFLKSGLVKQIDGIVNSGQPLAWQTMRGLRTRIGEYLENPQLIADAGSAQAKRLYGAMTEDLKATAQASTNPNALPLFNLANDYTRQGHEFIGDVLQPFMSKDAGSAAQTILTSANRGDQIVKPLRQNIPQLADEIAGFKLRDMAAATAGRQNATGTAVSPSSFLTDWNKLSPEAKASLYSDPAVAKRVDALATISDNVKKRVDLLNTSKTAHHTALTSTALAAAEGGRLGYEAHGIPGAIAGAAAGASVIPGFNYAYSLLGADRPLARLLAAQGPNAGIAPYLGGAAANQGLLAAPAPRQGLLQ